MFFMVHCVVVTVLRMVCSRSIWPCTAVLLPHRDANILHTNSVAEWLLHQRAGRRVCKETHCSANVSRNAVLPTHCDYCIIARIPHMYSDSVYWTCSQKAKNQKAKQTI